MIDAIMQKVELWKDAVNLDNPDEVQKYMYCIEEMDNSNA